MSGHDNFSKFATLVNKHLYYMPLGFGEGYDNKFTRYSQLYVIVNIFLIDFFKKGIHKNNDTLDKLKEYESLFLNKKNESLNLTIEEEIIDFLLSLDPVYGLIREI